MKTVFSEIQMGNRKDRKRISTEFNDLAGNVRKYIFCYPSGTSALRSASCSAANAVRLCNAIRLQIEDLKAVGELKIASDLQRE
jgi:hypothetical protein